LQEICIPDAPIDLTHHLVHKSPTDFLLTRAMLTTIFRVLEYFPFGNTPFSF
jgi:hypothetical protein